MALRNKNLRWMIKTYLREQGASITTDVFDYVNENHAYGVSMNKLGNLLTKDPDIVKVGFFESPLMHVEHPTRGVATLNRKRNCVWAPVHGPLRKG